MDFPSSVFLSVFSHFQIILLIYVSINKPGKQTTGLSPQFLSNQIKPKLCQVPKLRSTGLTSLIFSLRKFVVVSFEFKDPQQDGVTFDDKTSTA